MEQLVPRQHSLLLYLLLYKAAPVIKEVLVKADLIKEALAKVILINKAQVRLVQTKGLIIKVDLKDRQTALRTAVPLVDLPQTVLIRATRIKAGLIVKEVTEQLTRAKRAPAQVVRANRIMGHKVSRAALVKVARMGREAPAVKVVTKKILVRQKFREAALLHLREQLAIYQSPYLEIFPSSTGRHWLQGPVHQLSQLPSTINQLT